MSFKFIYFNVISFKYILIKIHQNHFIINYIPPDPKPKNFWSKLNNKDPFYNIKKHGNRKAK